MAPIARHYNASRRPGKPFAVRLAQASMLKHSIVAPIQRRFFLSERIQAFVCRR